MARIELAPEIMEDFDRIFDHLANASATDPSSGIREIIAGIDVLSQNPLIGRPAASGKRELIIGRRSHGYVVLYSYIDAIDTVFVLAVRGQREAGYVR